MDPLHLVTKGGFCKEEMHAGSCAVDPIPSLQGKGGDLPPTGSLVDASMVSPTTEYVAPRVRGWKYPGAWMLSRSLEGETRTRDQPVSRLAKLVVAAWSSQSLPGQGRNRVPVLGEKQMCPHTSMLGASNTASSGHKRPWQLRKEAQFPRIRTYRWTGLLTALRSQESTVREWSAENIREEGQEHCQLREEEAEQAPKDVKTHLPLPVCSAPPAPGRAGKWGQGRREPRSPPLAPSQPPAEARPAGYGRRWW